MILDVKLKGKMIRKIILCLVYCALHVTMLLAQEIKQLHSGDKLSLRGLSVVNDNVIWTSGSNGTVGRSVDGGKNWEWNKVKGYEKNDFRDIEASSKTTAVIMSVADPAYILKTTDGGHSWKKVYENKTKGMFLDAMEFADDKNGVVVGDPMNGKFFIATTADGGDSWKELSIPERPAADSGEACFASSGTNVRMFDKNSFCFISGGLHSNLITGTKKVDLPVIQGKESTGANSIAIKDKNTFMVVGGDFSTADSTNKNSSFTGDGGQSWTSPLEPPHGYRSCVEFIKDNTWITCGLNGVDITTDNGKHWKQISPVSYHSCRKAKNGKAVFLSGNNGNIGRLEFGN